MIVKLCDACKCVLEEEIEEKAYDYNRGFELCSSCHEKFNKIKKEYYKKDEELQKEREKLYNNYVSELKNEIGLDYEKYGGNKQ